MIFADLTPEGKKGSKLMAFQSHSGPHAASLCTTMVTDEIIAALQAKYSTAEEKYDCFLRSLWEKITEYLSESLFKISPEDSRDIPVYTNCSTWSSLPTDINTVVPLLLLVWINQCKVDSCVLLNWGHNHCSGK